MLGFCIVVFVVLINTIPFGSSCTFIFVVLNFFNDDFTIGV